MRHASAASLSRIEDLLAALRADPRLKEKTRGVFYVGARAFLHFHEDPAGLFADIRPGSEWERLPVNTQAERCLLLRVVQTPTPALPRKRGRVRVGAPRL
jgi:hypothetical protein